MYKVLFLCTGNSCRSIIAEALLNHLADGRFKAWSAGSFPTGSVNPDSIKILKESGIDTNSFYSKSWDDLSHIEFDIVITVCDNAAKAACPVYLGNAIKAHWGLPDPDKVAESNGRELAFKQTFHKLGHLINSMLKLLPDDLNSENLSEIRKELA